MKKLLIALLTLVVLLTGCSQPAEPAKTDEKTEMKEEKETAAPTTEGKELVVYAFEGGYGKDHWEAMARGFEALNEGVTVKLTTAANVDELLTPLISAGTYPDVVYYNQGQPSGFTEGLIKSKQIADITDVLALTIPGESKTVGEKLSDGFATSPTASPYGDGKLYLAPVFTSGPGLAYNANLIGEGKTYAYPKTWDDFFALAEKAKAEGIAAFTYPTPGYLDAMIPVMVANAGGEELLKRFLNFEKGVYEDPNMIKVLETVAKLKDYAYEQTSANASKDKGHLDNQFAVMENKALFMPNGDWVVGEMKDYNDKAAEGFKWALGPVPVFNAGDKPHVVSWFETTFVMDKAPQKDLAKQFIAYMYSDEAQAAIAKVGAYQPTKNSADFMPEDVKAFKAQLTGDVVTISGTGFAAFNPIPGLDWQNVLFGSLNEVFTGQLSPEDYIKNVAEANDRISEEVIK